ncbi:hypothetical protein AAFC00_003405 [Neodothiora populina]|uniref:SRP9 domain-containing protein n=1 Tax=Neodothiora populina TaxID=2781224 RepID=A0ABR3PE22_9PEZI
MSYFATSEEWQRQSALLLQARPSTTRITTKYHIPSATPSTRQTERHAKKLAKRTTSTATSQTETTTTTKPQPAHLELKTYDPVSGTCLKYKTQKSAEVGRLIASLGRLAGFMAAVPGASVEEPVSDKKEDVEMKDVVGGAVEAVQQVVASATGQTTTTTPGAAGNGGGKNKKKKKGKR